VVPAPEAKAALRRRMRLMGDLIDDRLLRSVQLWADVAARAEYARAPVVMAFVTLAGEPDADPLLARLDRDAKTLVLPRIAGAGLAAARVGEGMIPGTRGVPEPSGDVVELDIHDLVLVPGLAFTIEGARLGRGGGHYDRFLRTCPATTIGVCFAEQLVDELPLETHDICVSAVITC